MDAQAQTMLQGGYRGNGGDVAAGGAAELPRGGRLAGQQCEQVRKVVQQARSRLHQLRHRGLADAQPDVQAVGVAGDGGAGATCQFSQRRHVPQDHRHRLLRRLLDGLDLGVESESRVSILCLQIAIC